MKLMGSPFNFNFLATEFLINVDCEQLSHMTRSWDSEFATLTMTIGFRVEPIFAPLTAAELDFTEVVFPLVFNQLARVLHSSVLQQI